MLLWKFSYMCLGAHMHTFLLGIYLQMELLGHTVCMYSTLLFSKVFIPLYIPTSSVLSFIVHILNNWYSHFRFSQYGGYGVIFNKTMHLFIFLLVISCWLIVQVLPFILLDFLYACYSYVDILCILKIWVICVGNFSLIWQSSLA